MGRDSLKLSFNRSISEPGHAGLTTCPMAPLTSPPSLGPSLHPPKRCRMDGLSRSKPLSLAPPSSFLSPPAPPGGVVSLPASPATNLPRGCGQEKVALEDSLSSCSTVDPSSPTTSVTSGAPSTSTAVIGSTESVCSREKLVWQIWPQQKRARRL